MLDHLWAWIGFGAFVLGMLALDLGILNRKSREVSLKKALAWSAVWIGLALSFNAGIYYWHSAEKALQFLTAYLVELSLSVDNLFVFLLVFGYLKVPAEYRHKALFWGILGALLHACGNHRRWNLSSRSSTGLSTVSAFCWSPLE